MATTTSANHGVGRRKSAVARVWIKPGKGEILVNGRKYSEYFDTDISRNLVLLPFKTVGLSNKFDADVNVKGGGIVSQAGAVKLGLSRALVVNDSNLRLVLKKAKLLHCDSRVKERKKYGQKGARAKFQFVKR
ncbi:30S ribosomal protein S9 [Candidatus Babeliales bacterium]|nr:30S ribosomal protein S9 [Candidatus Babeliales bacterium]